MMYNIYNYIIKRSLLNRSAEMNIQIQTFGLLILALLYVFYKSIRTLQLYSEKIFRRTLYISIISLTLDILSIVGINFMSDIPYFIVILTCKLYIMSLMWEMVSVLSYVLTDLYSEKKHRRITSILWLIVFIQSIIVALLPISIFHEGNIVYTYGASVMTVYAFSVIYIIGLIGSIIAFRKRINKRRRFAVGMWMALWIIAALLQFIDNSLLIVGFASVIGMLIMFVVMENPESNLDRRTGCFNSYALSQYSRRLFERKTHFSLLEIRDKEAESVDEEDITEFPLQSTASLAAANHELFVFRNVNDLIIISENTELLRNVSDRLLSEANNHAKICKAHYGVLVRNGECFSNMSELAHFMAYVGGSYAENDEKLYIADEKTVKKYRERAVIEQEITDALDEDRVEVYLQPIYSNSEQKFTSAEALVRIRQADNSLLSPGVFIPFAEDSGLIIRLGERVFEKVCHFLKEYDAEKLGIHYIEVNLSVVQCEMEDLAERLISIIERYNVNPSLINLEITETASVTSQSVLLRNMEKLIDFGFTFSLDDFGKGQSNLMYVVEMPVSIIKLDYDMSKAFFNSPKAKQVVRAVVSMAHGMNLKLVAEGIETKEEIDGMFKEKIDYIQGFYYSKPLPMQEFVSFISK